MTECELCGYKIHFNKNLEQSVIILKNEMNQKESDHIYHDNNISFTQNSLCFDCITILYKQLQKQKECETIINTCLINILEKEPPKSTINYTEIINTLESDFENLYKVNKTLEEKITELKTQKEILQSKKNILNKLANKYWESRNDLEYKLRN